MTLFDVWQVCPRTHVFVKTRYGLTEYNGVDWIDLRGGGKAYADSEVADIHAVSYPETRSAIEVILKGAWWDDIRNGREVL